MDNAEKNTYVKKRLTASLLELLETKEFREISVSEIAEAAGVHRVSFYRNYTEKEDVLREYIKYTYGQWVAEHPAAADPLPALFDYLREYAPLYRLLHRRRLLPLFKDVLFSSIGPRPEYENGAAYATAFLANGVYGWIEEWVARGMQESAEALAEMMRRGQ